MSSHWSRVVSVVSVMALAACSGGAGTVPSRATALSYQTTGGVPAAAAKRVDVRVIGAQGGRICGTAGAVLPAGAGLPTKLLASYARAVRVHPNCPLVMQGLASRHVMAARHVSSLRRHTRTGCWDWWTNDPEGSGELIYGGGDHSGCDDGGGSSGGGGGSSGGGGGGDPGLIDGGGGGGGGGGSGGGVACGTLVSAITRDDVNNFLQALANAFNFSWSTDLGPKVNSFSSGVKDNVNKFGKGNDVNGRIYDHANDMFGKSASQLSDGERQMYDWMKYAGPAFRDTNRGFFGTQMSNPNFELYVIPSEKWVNIAQYNGVTTTLTKGDYVITFFDRSRNMWVSTYEVTKAELQKKSASFLRVTQQSYEPGWDQAMEDDADNYDWGAFDDALYAADDAAIGC